MSASNPLFEWIFTTIYASLDLNTCFQFWDNLSFFASSHSLSWLMAGNFNDIMGNNENLSYSSPNCNYIAHFNNVLNDCNLLNLGYNDPRLMWKNKKDSRLVMKRLDRALCNPSWQLLFEETKVVHFLRTSSNHNPILINTLPSPPHPCNHPFHLKTMWFNNSFFPNVVNDA